jgi:hypothetical protein
MADSATLPQCLVLIHKRAALLRVTLEAGFVWAQESKPASLKRLLNVCWRTFNRYPLVRLVTIGAAHLAFRYRMMMRQLECRANFQVTLKTRVRRLAGINDRVRRAAALYVQTPRPVTRFDEYAQKQKVVTTHFFGFFLITISEFTDTSARRLPHDIASAICSKTF